MTYILLLILYLIAVDLTYCLVEGHTLTSCIRKANRKVCGIRFMRLGKLSFSYCITR